MTNVFKYDDFQVDAFNAIDNNKNVLVCAPTGSGKTAVAEHAIKRALNEDSRLVYLSPVKALSNEKFHSLSEKYGTDNVGIVTGDHKINIDAKICIMTTEIFRNELFNDKCEYKYIVFDEVHYINDPSRGSTWEEVFMMLRVHDVCLIMLSATIVNAPKLQLWLNGMEKRETILIENHIRPVPLEHYLYVDSQMCKNLIKANDEWSLNIHHHVSKDPLIKLLDSNKILQEDNYKTFLDIAKLGKDVRPNMRSMLNTLFIKLDEMDACPAIVFVFSKKLCDELAMTVTYNGIKSRQVAEALKYLKHMVITKANPLLDSEQYNLIKMAVSKGIGIHHAGLLPFFKEIVEELFKRKLINILFATETFAVGVNVPARTVVFTSFTKPSGKHQRLLRTDEYFQMAGRAGRRGIDTYGMVIHLNTPIKNDDIHELPCLEELISIFYRTLPPLMSKFKLTYQYIANMIIQNKEYNDIINTTKLSMLQQENNAQGKYIQNEYDGLKESVVLTKGFKSKRKQKKSIANDIMKDNLFSLADKIRKCTHELDDTVYSYMNTLKRMNYIDDSGVKLTRRGEILAQCYDCNPFIFTELICQGLLKNVSHYEVLIIFASLTQTRNGNIGRFNITPTLDKLLNKVEGICNRMSKGVDSIEFNVNYVAANNVHNWLTNYSFDNTYEGEFYQTLQSVYRLNIIYKDILTEMKDYDTLDKMIDEEVLLHGIFNTYSLYI